jgi:hypothetical protein
MFHLAVVIEELERLSRLLGSPEEPDKELLTRVPRRFFLHAVPHLVAAGQLYDFVPRIFPEQNGVHVLEDLGPQHGTGSENGGISSQDHPGSRSIISNPAAT